MCGFVTILTAPGHELRPSVLTGLTRMLDHRGPDDTGYAAVDPRSGNVRSWRADEPIEGNLSGVLMGHNRLSIVDLSPAGHQPYVSEDQSLVLAYNGEIFNYVELRDELRAAGHSFRGGSDTEVLLRAYEHWGVACLERLNGMWSFALWDGRERKLVASRDRFGIKPLHFARVGETWVFASEIKALLGFPGVSQGVDEANVREFLVSGLVDHTQETLFRGIHSLDPASYLEIADGHLSTRRFWHLPVERPLLSGSDDRIIDEFRELLGDAVRLRMRADVPIGTMLSGGLDSTSIASLVHLGRSEASAAAHPDAPERSAFQHAFTACWPDWVDNEEEPVELVSREFGLSLHKLFATPEQMAEALPSVAYALDEPFESPIPVIQFQLMRMAREHGIKVVLNGHGADEILAGYPDVMVPPFLAGLVLRGRWGRFAAERRAFESVGDWERADLYKAIIREMVPHALRPRIREFLRDSEAGRTGIFSAGDRRSRVGRPPHVTKALRGLSTLSAAGWLAFVEAILPRWLRMEDRMSMAHSIESRLPFMDYRLIEFGFRLPDDLKLRSGYTKYVLRKAMSGRLPGAIVDQRKKQRFAAPYMDWFQGPWRPLMQDLFLDGSCKIEPYLERARFRERLGASLSGRAGGLDPLLLWRLLNTELWLRAYATDRTVH